MNSRSLRTVYSTCSSNARSNGSGGMDGRPVVEYSRANCADIDRSASSVSGRIARSGWSAGTRCSGDRWLNMCWVCSSGPRTLGLLS